MFGSVYEKDDTLFRQGKEEFIMTFHKKLFKIDRKMKQQTKHDNIKSMLLTIPFLVTAFNSKIYS